jgi:hypothetical protein
MARSAPGRITSRRWRGLGSGLGFWHAPLRRPGRVASGSVALPGNDPPACRPAPLSPRFCARAGRVLSCPAPGPGSGSCPGPGPARDGSGPAPTLRGPAREAMARRARSRSDPMPDFPETNFPRLVLVPAQFGYGTSAARRGCAEFWEYVRLVAAPGDRSELDQSWIRVGSVQPLVAYPSPGPFPVG